MEYNHLLERYDDMALIVTLILPEHTEAVMVEIGKAMNISIELDKVLSAVQSKDTKGKNKVCIFEKDRDFVFIDCHSDLHQIIIRCLAIEKERIYDSFEKYIRLRQEGYDQPICRETIDWMHPDNKYEKVKYPLLSQLQYHKLVSDVTK